MAQINPGHRKNIRSSRNDSKSSFTGKSAAYTVEKPCSPAHVLRFEGKCFIFRPCLLTTSAYSPGQEREETGWSASEGPNSCPREARTAVILEVDPHTNDLRSFFYDPKLIATDGVGGQSAKKHGKNGKSVIGKVPPGTIIYRSNASSMAEATWLEREGEGIELEKIADLTEIGTRFTLCQGGLGGKGNWHFRSATNQAPTEAEMGTEGEEGVFFMELRRIADAGLVGYPNAGKSTLLGDISEAKPKVASYPFTTLQPIIGVVEFDSFRRCIVADIPGIIEGAHNNRGLGHEFLRHITRCKVLVFVLDMAGSEGRDPIEDLQNLRTEIKLYSEDLAKQPWFVVANKMDLEGAEENLVNFRMRFPKVDVIPISALNGDGISRLRNRLDELVGYKFIR